MKKQSEDLGSPQTLEEITNKILHLNEKGGRHKIGKRALSAIQNMLDNPYEAAVFSISALAEKNGINASTLTRLANKLGYTGFSELQSIFRDHIAEGQRYYSSHIKQLLHPVDEDDRENIMHLVAREEVSNIMKIAEQTEPDCLRNTAKALIDKRKVHILGLRSSFSISHYLAYYLGMIGISVKILGAIGQTLAEDLAEIRKGDTVVVISFRPYTKDTVVAFRRAKKVGAEIVSITDNILSPIIDKKGNTLIAENRSPFFFDSTASALVLTQALLAEVANLLGDQAITELKIREALFEEMGTEFL